MTAYKTIIITTYEYLKFNCETIAVFNQPKISEQGCLIAKILLA